jgi:hypothetical protein
MAAGGDHTFDDEMRAYYGCVEGAYSEVTETEAKDGQITLTGDEKRIVQDFFGADELAKFRGNDAELEANGLDASRSFRIYPSGKIVRPKLKYPKSEGSELRLYFSEDSFKVDAGRFWGVFRRDDGDLWLCHFGEQGLKTVEEQSLGEKTRLEILDDDEDDESYQEAANDPEKIEKTSKTWKRNPALGYQAIKRVGFACELFPAFTTFQSKTTNKPFMEAHHIVPLGLQDSFDGPERNLDQLDNIASLNPWSHRLIHHGRFVDFQEPLAKLVQSRSTLLGRLGLTVDEVMGLYDR